MTHVSANEKNLHPGGRKLILFNQFSGHILCSLVSFAFLILVLFVCLIDVFFKSKMYILIPIWIFDKKIFTRPISGNMTTFFGLNTLFLIHAVNICELHYLEFDSFLHRKMKRKERNNCLEHCSWFSDLDLCNQFWNY